MMHKYFKYLLSLVVVSALALESQSAQAEIRPVVVLESSSSGRLVRINLGGSSGLASGDPVLFSANDRKVAAGRVFKVDGETAIIAVLEKYESSPPTVDLDYDLLFGEPFPEAANLPDYVVDRENERPNPRNERFLEQGEREETPDLDDDNYTPEVNLRPKFPEPRTYSPHNITVGFSLNRNRSMPSRTDPGAGANDLNRSNYTTYQGYSLRYAYTFRTHYWLKARAPALLSAEMSLSIYNFFHAFPAYDDGETSLPERDADIRVISPAFNVRYLVEVSKLFRLYPYLGYQYNIASAGGSNRQNSIDGGSLPYLQLIRGGRILGGLGGQLVISKDIDFRAEVGSDGLMSGLVVKF